MAKKVVKNIGKKLTKKELEEIALREQMSEVATYAENNAIAVDTSSLSHFAAAETVATDATAVAATTATTIGGISMGTIALGALAIGGVAAAASGGGGSSDAAPTDPTTPPADTGSITYERVLLNEEHTYYNGDGSINYVDPAEYISLGILSGGKDIDLSTLTGIPSDFVGLDGKADTGINEIKLTLADVLSKGNEGTNEEGESTSFFLLRGGNEDIVDIDLENWTDEGVEAISDIATASLNGNYHIYTANGAELMILDGMQII